MLVQAQSQVGSYFGWCKDSLLKVLQVPEKIVERSLGDLASALQKQGCGERAVRVFLFCMSADIIAECGYSYVQQVESSDLPTECLSAMVKSVALITACSGLVMSLPGNREFRVFPGGSRGEYALKEMPRFFLRTNLISSFGAGWVLLSSVTMPKPWTLPVTRALHCAAINVVGNIASGTMDLVRRHYDHKKKD